MHPVPPTAPTPAWTTFTWPRTYRSGGFGAALVYALCAGLFAGGAFTLRHLLRMEAPTSGRVAVLAIAGVALAAAGALLTAEMLLSRCTLSLDAIEYGGLFGRRSLRRSEIAGYRTWVANGVTTYRLIPSVAGQKHIDLSAFGLDADEALLPWVRSLTDLDEAERAAAREAALADPALGADVAERAARLALAKRVAALLNGATTLLCAWALVYPRPFFVVATLLALLPWVALAIVARAPAMFTLAEAPDGARGGLGLPFIIPGAVLSLRVMQDLHLVDWTQAIAPTAAALGALLVGHHVATRPRKVAAGERVMVALLGVMWAASAVMLANAALDQGTPWACTRVRVVGHHVSRGKATTWYLRLDPSGPLREHSEVVVHRGVYERAPVGGEVCVGLRPGGLGMPRYAVTAVPCPDEPPARR